ncbi:hypothetical protein JYT72_01040 [Crocinitomix catalasitica]|nr:hypothetical protein [Crocinitomix catalasitica]
MKKIIIASLAVMVASCGEAQELSELESSKETSNNLSDTLADDSLVGEDDKIQFFEDYARFDTKTKLYEEFGKENLEDSETWYAEGTYRVVITTLTDPNNGNVIQFSWDEENEEALSFIETWNRNWRDENGNEQRIETKEGIYTGMSLEDLVAWNEGENFEFSGFGWDYAGGVFAGAESKISKAKIQFTLDLKDEGYESFLHLLGDGSHKTSDEDVKGAPIVVGTITYNL